ncbi:MAG: hydroxyacylglutathione hydrolase, partial [Acetobacteraceae bacterium]|nr:hydroxyacylglutathione hydrolase [Acetobacteraceae bacterium]
DHDNADLHEFVGKVEQLRAAVQPSVPSVLCDELKANPFLTAPDAASFATLRAKKDRF